MDVELLDDGEDVQLIVEENPSWEATSPSSSSSVDDRELLERFCPIFVFQRTEKYFPCKVESYLEYCELRFGAEEVVLRRGEVTPEGLVSQRKMWTHPEDKVETELFSGYDHRPKNIKKRRELSHHLGLWNLVPDPQIIHGIVCDSISDVSEEMIGKHLSETPVYSCISRPDPGVLELKYFPIYPYNGEYRLFGIECLVAGQHWADIEHLTVRLDEETLEIERVYFAAHTGKDGVWKLPTDIEWRGSRPVAFVAKGGHGHYPSAGRWLRLFCAANDLTGGGYEWDPKSRVVQVFDPTDPRCGQETPWNRFIGRWDNRYAQRSPAWKSWWHKEKGRSTNGLRRFFGCC